MTARIGLGSIAAGGYLAVNIDRTKMAFVDVLSGFGEIVPALPGLLALFGTALLGLALIQIARWSRLFYASIRCRYGLEDILP
jgi:hypothetical protein